MTQDEEKNNDIILTKEEVWNVLEFAKSLSAGVLYPAYLTPELISARMKEISYSPVTPTQAELDQALSDPKNHETQLRSYVESFEILSMPFKRILSYLSSLPAFDLMYTARVSDEKDYKSRVFKKDQELLHEFFDKFDYIHFFRNVVKQLLRNEVYVGSLREDNDKIVLQELPLQYCKITARGSYGLLASFNMYYFLVPGVDVNLYHPFFKEKYIDLFKATEKKYQPSISPELRGQSEWFYWVDLPPEVGWAFKLDTSLINAVPYFTGMMPYLLQESVMLKLQKNLNMAAASKILIGEVPMLKEAKANVKDMIAVDPKTLGSFLSLVKNAIGDSIKVASAPLTNIDALSFDGDNELLDKWTRTEMSISGMNTALIYSSQVKANVIDSQLSFQADSKIVEQQLYPQFASFLEYWVNKRLSKTKYSFTLLGNDYYLDRKDRFEKAMGLADKGIVLPQLFSSALGMRPQDLYRMMQESKAMGFADMLTPIISGFQMPKEEGAGRPQKGEDEIGDSGAQTRQTGANTTRGGKV